MTRVVFFGNERLVSGLDKTTAPVLNGLIEKGYEVAAIVSHHSTTHSRNERALEVAEVASQHNIPLYLPGRPAEIIDTLRELQPDIAVLAAYGRIVSQDIIDLFPGGIINIHPSLLPAYRGPTPIETAILNGDTKTGVSIMQLSAGMDEGPVYAQKEIRLSGAETKFELYAKITDLASDLFFESFPRIIDGSLQPVPQDNSAATYSKLIQKTDGIINWDEPATEIERKVRAYAGWPQSRANLRGIDIIVTSSHVVQDSTVPVGAVESPDRQTLLVGTGSGGALSIDTIKPVGKKEMPIKAFLLGYGSLLDAAS